MVLKSGSRTFYIVSVLVCAVFASFMPELAWVIAVVRRVFMAYVFIAIGQSFKRCFLSTNKMAMLICLSCIIVVCAFNRSVDMSMREFDNPILYLIGGIAGAYFTLSIAKMIRSRLLERWGRESLTIMGTHQNVITIINSVTGSTTYSIPIQMLALALIVVYEIGTIFVLNKFLPFLIGKKNIYREII